FGRSADVDDGHAAGELGKALLELLAVVVGGGLVDLTTDLLHAGLDVGRLAGALDDGGVFLVNGDVLGAAEVGDLHVLKLDAEVLGDAAAAGEHGDVFEHGLAAVAEAGGLDGADVEGAADLVDHESGEGLALDVLGDEEQGL